MPDVLHLLIDRIDTPIGELLLVADNAGKLRAVDWSDYESRMLRFLRLHYGKMDSTSNRPTILMVSGIQSTVTLRVTSKP